MIAFMRALLLKVMSGGRIKRTSMGSATMFCKKTGWFSSVDVLQHVISEEGELSLENLQGVLLKRFGVEINLLALKNIIRRSDLTYDHETDSVRLCEDGMK